MTHQEEIIAQNGKPGLQNQSLFSNAPQKIQPYQQQGYPSAEDIERAKEIYKLTRSQRKSKVQEFAKGPDNKEFYGKSIQVLANAFKEGNQNLLETLSKLEQTIQPKNVSSMDLGVSLMDKRQNSRISNAAINDAVFDKTQMMPTAQNLEHLKQSLGLDKITHRKLKELILLDDWASIAQQAMPYILEYGAPAIQKLYKRYVEPTLRRFLGDDAGLDPNDFSNNNVSQPSKRSIIGGVTYESPSYPPIRLGQLALDAVCTEAIATVVCPEEFRKRLPFNYPTRTAVTTGSTNFIGTTDAAGNLAIFINPWNPGVVSGAASGAFALLATGYLPGGGSFTGNTFINGSLSTSVANLSTFKVTGFAVNVIPITSANNSQGDYEVGFFQNMNLATVQGTVPQQSLQNCQYYQTGNALTSYRSIFLPDPYDELSPIGNTQIWNDFFMVLVTGAAALTPVVKIEISYVYEVVPNFTSQNIMAQDYATPGAFTLDAIAAMMYAAPGVQMLTYADAVAFATKINQADPRYDCVVNTILGNPLKPKTKKSMMITNSGQQQNQNPEEISFDMISS